jgi:hypothetical protein
LFACKCDVSDDIKAIYKNSEIIVHGKVISKEFVALSQSFTGKGMELVCNSYKSDTQILDLLETEFLIKVELEVIETYKGKGLPKMITVYTSRFSASCGYLAFEIGNEYQIYLSSNCYFNFKFKKANLGKRHYNGFWTSRCTRNRVFDLAEDGELKKLMKK